MIPVYRDQCRLTFPVARSLVLEELPILEHNVLTEATADLRFLPTMFTDISANLRVRGQDLSLHVLVSTGDVIS